MKNRYLLALFLLIILSIIIFFRSEQPKNKPTSSQRNFVGTLSPSKTINVQYAFGLCKADSGFFVLRETTPLFVNFDLDTFPAPGGATYYISKFKDTLIYLDEKTTTFFQKSPAELTKFNVEKNSGYALYSKGQLFYERRISTGDTIKPGQNTLLIRKNLSSGMKDTLLLLDDYIEQRWKDLEAEELFLIATGKFYELADNKVAYVPDGVNRIFVFDNHSTNHAEFIPMGNREIIRWHRISMTVPGYGEVFSYKPKDGGASQLFKGIGQYKGKIYVGHNTVYKEGSSFFYYVDLYYDKSFEYIQTLKINVQDPKTTYLVATAFVGGKYLTLDEKNNINIYNLPL